MSAFEEHWPLLGLESRDLLYTAIGMAVLHGDGTVTARHLLKAMFAGSKGSLAGDLLEWAGPGYAALDARFGKENWTSDVRPGVTVAEDCLRVLECATRECKPSDVPYCDGEHLALAVLTVKDTSAMRVLTELKVDAEATRQAIRKLLFEEDVPGA